MINIFSKRKALVDIYHFDWKVFSNFHLKNTLVYFSKSLSRVELQTRLSWDKVENKL